MSVYTISPNTLPASWPVNTLVVVSDSSDGTCTSGGGSKIVWCRYNGITWDSLIPPGAISFPLLAPNGTAQFGCTTDNLCDIGASGSNRIRTGFFGTSVVAGASGQNGQAVFPGATSGSAVITAQSAQGSPTLTLPNTSGTFAVVVGTPFLLNTTTGQLTCCAGSLAWPSADTGQIQAPSGACGTPSHSFAAALTTGLYLQGSNNIGACSGNNYVWATGSTGIRVSTAGGYMFASNATAGTSADTGFSRLTGAGNVGLGNGTVGDTSGTLVASGHAVPFTSTAAMTAGQVVKIDTANNNSVIKVATTDTGAGIAIGVVLNGPGAAGVAYVATSGFTSAAVLGTGTCAVGNFVIVDTTTAGRVKCTATYTAGTVVGIATTAQATVGSTVPMLIQIK